MYIQDRKCFLVRAIGTVCFAILFSGCGYKKAAEGNSDQEALCNNFEIVDNCPYEYEGVAEKVLSIAQPYAAGSIEEAIARHGKGGKVERSVHIPSHAKITSDDHVISLLQTEGSNVNCAWSSLTKEGKDFDMEFLPDGTLVCASGAFPGVEGWNAFWFYPSGHIRALSRPIEGRQHEYFTIRFSPTGKKRVFLRSHITVREGVDPVSQAKKEYDFYLGVEKLLAE